MAVNPKLIPYTGLYLETILGRPQIGVCLDGTKQQRPLHFFIATPHRPFASNIFWQQDLTAMYLRAHLLEALRPSWQSVVDLMLDLCLTPTSTAVWHHRDSQSLPPSYRNLVSAANNLPAAQIWASGEGNSFWQYPLLYRAIKLS